MCMFLTACMLVTACMRVLVRVSVCVRARLRDCVHACVIVKPETTCVCVVVTTGRMSVLRISADPPAHLSDPHIQFGDEVQEKSVAAIQHVPRELVVLLNI